MSIVEELGQSSDRAAAYMSLFRDLMPLGLLSFVVALVMGLYRLRIAPLLKKPLRLVLTMLNTVLYSALTSFVAVSGVMLLPHVVPEPSPQLEVGALIMITLCGVQMYVGIASRLTGIPPEKIRGMLMTQEFLTEVRDGLTPEQCREHAELCPFKQEHAERIGLERREAEHATEYFSPGHGTDSGREAQIGGKLSGTAVGTAEPARGVQNQKDGKAE